MINTEKAYNLINKNISCVKKTNKVNIKKSIGLYLAEDIKSNINIHPQYGYYVRRCIILK